MANAGAAASADSARSAKHIGAWPEAGLRYLASFAFEYVLWPVGCLLLIVGLRRARAVWLRRGIRENMHVLITLGTLVVHAGYYTLVVGGDHFEYRIYAPYIPLLWLAAAWAAAQVAPTGRRAALLASLVMAPSVLLPWALWRDEKSVGAYDAVKERVPNARAALPWPLAAYLTRWAHDQTWLLEHGSGIRAWEHRRFAELVEATIPSRVEMAKIQWEPDHPILVASGVGIVGWVFPNVAVIDTRGLNDHQVARTKWREQKKRYMAHDRRPPAGYVHCFRQNVNAVTGEVKRRIPPMTEADVIDCEARDWAPVSHARD